MYKINMTQLSHASLLRINDLLDEFARAVTDGDHAGIEKLTVEFITLTKLPDFLLDQFLRFRLVSVLNNENIFSDSTVRFSDVVHKQISTYAASLDIFNKYKTDTPKLFSAVLTCVNIVLITDVFQLLMD